MLDSLDSAAELAYRSEHNVMPERKRMQSHTNRLTIGATWARGTRKQARAIPPRYLNDDLRVFREISKLSRQAIANYVDRLMGPG